MHGAWFGVVSAVRDFAGLVLGRCLTQVPGDAGATSWTACYLVNVKGIGQPRQRA